MPGRRKLLTDWMKHKSPGDLSNQTSQEWDNCAATRTHAADEPDGEHLDIPWQEAREHHLSARVDGAKQQTQDRDSHRLGNDVWNKPAEQLEDYDTNAHPEDEVLFSCPTGGIGQNKSSNSNPTPKSRRDISDFCRIGTSLAASQLRTEGEVTKAYSMNQICNEPA